MSAGEAKKNTLGHSAYSCPVHARPAEALRVPPALPPCRNFDEGQGWRVHDVTGRGHDLLAAENPRWEVVRWLSVCGNGG